MAQLAPPTIRRVSLLVAFISSAFIRYATPKINAFLEQEFVAMRNLPRKALSALIFLVCPILSRLVNAKQQCAQNQLLGGDEMLSTSLGAKYSIADAFSSSSRTNSCSQHKGWVLTNSKHNIHAAWRLKYLAIKRIRAFQMKSAIRLRTEGSS
jgi:hypothetical protein